MVTPVDPPVARSSRCTARHRADAGRGSAHCRMTSHPATTRQFDRLSKACARWTGRPLTFLLAVAVVLLWLVTGPVFHYSDTWQLVINTATTVITFLMVFLIQNTQTRDTQAIQIKLDELIRATEAASDALMDLEELDEMTLDRYRAHYETLARNERVRIPEPAPASDEHRTGL